MTDQEILAAIAQQESGGDPNAVGKSGEIGKYQFMPDTLKALGGSAKVKGNAEAQDRLAQKHLAGLRARYGEDDQKIIAAWNAGEGGVDNAVKQAGQGGDWRSFLPKGTNAKGVQYDSGAYLKNVTAKMQPQEQQPAQQQQQPAIVPASYSPGPRERTDPTVSVRNAYQQAQEADLDNWLEQKSGSRAKAQAEKAAQPAQPEAPKPQEQPKGGFFNSVGSAFKGIADAIVPPTPRAGGNNILQSIVEKAASVPLEAIHDLPGQLGELLNPSPEEAQRRSSLPVVQGAKELGGKVAEAVGTGFNIPFGPVTGAAEGAMSGAVQTAETLQPTLTDEAIDKQIVDLRASVVGTPQDPLAQTQASQDSAAAYVEKIKELESLKRMPYDERVRLHAESAGQEAGMIAGMVTAKPLGGATSMFFKGASEAALAAKTARNATIAAAGEKAMAARAATDLVGHGGHEMRPAAAVKADLAAGDKLRALEAQPEARAAIDEIFAENAPQKPAANDTVRLYRGEGPKENSPFWHDQSMEENKGRWFTDDPAIAESYAKDIGRSGYVTQVDVPKDVYEASRVTSNAPGQITGATPAAPEGEFLLPREWASKASKPSPVARIVEDTTFGGKSQRAVMGPNDNMVVALDKDGNDLGYMWYTREPGGGYSVRKIETVAEHQKKGVATALDRAVSQVEGPYKGATDQTPAGKGFRASRGGAPKLERAPEQLYRELRDAYQGDIDLTEATLKSRGYSMPDIGQAENKALHEAMGLGRDASPAEKMAAQDVLAGAAHDMGIVPEAAVEALPAVNDIVKGLPAGDLKSVREVIASGLKDAENPLANLRSIQNAKGEEGKISAGVMFTLGRAALGGVLGSMQGDDAADHIKYALIGAGLGSVLSPTLATRIAKNLEKPAVRDALTKAITLHGETGAFNLRFPARGVGEGTNTRVMGVSDPAKRLVRGINEMLADANLLDRTGVVSHADVKAAASISKYKTVENILSLDSAKLTLDELAEAGHAASITRDAAAERTIQLGAEAKLNPTPEAQQAVMDHSILTSKLSQQVENMRTAYGRSLNALGITTDITQASKFELGAFAKELDAARAEIFARGNVTPAQFVDMVMDLSSKAATAKLANAASKWPEALWNIYYGMNLLGSPLTHLRNVIGNTGALAMSVIDRAGGEILSAPFRAVGIDTFRGQKLVQGGETMNLVSGIFETVADSFRAGSKKGAFGYMRDTWQSGNSVFGTTKNAEAMAAAKASLAAGDGGVPTIITAMASLASKNMKAMSSVDEFFKVLSFQGELRALAKRETSHLSGDARVAGYNELMNNPNKAMLRGANDFAHENTFTKAFEVGTVGKKAEDLANTPLAKALFTPFFRTPVRLAEFSTVHTPLLNVLAKQTASDIAAGGAKANLAMSKMATGLGIMGLTGYYAMRGYVTGLGPTDKDLKAKMVAAGWQEKSLWIGGKYVSYDNFEPLSTIMGTIATFVEAAPDMDDWSIQQFYSGGTLALSRNALSKQWFQGISDAVDCIEGLVKEGSADPLMTWGARKAAATIPGAATWRYLQNASGAERLESKTVSDNENPELRQWEKLGNILRQNIPGWGSHDVSELAGYKPKPAVMNPTTGEVIPNENQWLGFVSPSRVSTLKDDWAMHESVRLGGALPSELPRVIGGSQGPSSFKLENDPMKQIREGVKLSDEERHRLGVILTREVTDHEDRTLHESLNTLKGDEDYQDASDEGKAAMMKNRYGAFLLQAEEKLRGEYKSIDIAVQRRKGERDLNKFPKSMEDMKDPIRQMILQEAGQGQ
jgi:hypothetical protein